jgi:hypothetical protein
LFIFQGEQDIVRCFCCDLGLAEWDAKDNAWREHARHNPKCWFLKSQKGESYIKAANYILFTLKDKQKYGENLVVYLFGVFLKEQLKYEASRHAMSLSTFYALK